MKNFKTMLENIVETKTKKSLVEGVLAGRTFEGFYSAGSSCYIDFGGPRGFEFMTSRPLNFTGAKNKADLENIINEMHNVDFISVDIASHFGDSTVNVKVEYTNEDGDAIEESAHISGHGMQHNKKVNGQNQW